MKRYQSLILGMVLTFLLVAGGKPQEHKKEALTPVEVKTLTPEKIQETVILTAPAKALKDVLLSAEVSGKIKRKYVTTGQSIYQGQLLLLIDDTVISANYGAAQASLTQAKANYERNKTLKAEGLISEAQWEAIQSGYQQAQAQFAIAKNQYENTRIRSPFNGSVAEIHVEENESINPGASLINVIDTSWMEFTAGAVEEVALKLARGRTVKISFDSLSDQKFIGTIINVGLKADPDSQTYPVLIRMKNPGGKIKAGMVARIELGLQYHPKALMVRQDWILEKQNERGMFIVTQNAAVYRPVTLGFTQGDYVQVKSGLNPFEQMVVNGQKNLLDGEQVKIVTGNSQ